LPLWLATTTLARSADARPRLRDGALAGITLRGGASLAVRGEAIPRDFHDATGPFVDGWLVSQDLDDDAAIGSAIVPADRAALDVLDAHLVPREASAAHLARVRERRLPHPLGRGRGASIALEAGLKPMLRELIAVNDLESARARFEADGWRVEVSPLVFGPTHDGWLGRPESRAGTPRPSSLDRQPMYVGRDRARLREAIDAERAHTLEGARALGALLGYPSCCVEAFVSHVADRRAVRLWASAAERTPPDAFAARLAITDPNTFAYVSWFPCRFDCVPSIALADALAEIVAREHPDFVRLLDDALGAPRLVLAPEVQLRLQRDGDEERVLGTRVFSDPRAPGDPREEAIAARAIALVERARTLSLARGALLIDGARVPIPFDPPLPLLLPFRPRA
ncbi:MAG: hypothetical protein J0L92_34840, partial [Deltaproteobacteria bacterium]|nr:hypothetical protein [Deltaproteobacteria bacterium]